MTDSPTAARKPLGLKLDAQVKAALDGASRILKRDGAAEIAERAWAQLTAPPAPTSVVVIGEVKRGKSSLTNTLLGGVQASQVDVDIATSAFLRFSPPADGVPDRETKLLYAGGRERVVDFDDLPDWVTVTGSHVQDQTIEELPIGAEVALASPFVPNVVIVDTPGVGGLNPKHMQLAADVASRGSVLVMTCDAAAPITAPELAFLQAVSADIEAVVMVVTKTDKNMQHWKTIAEENRRLLRENAPRFADIPIVGVSNRRALSALQLPPGEERDTKLARTGLPELAAELVKVSQSADTLLTINCLRVLRNGLERIAGQLELEQSALDANTSTVVINELKAERERLKALIDQEKGGARDLLIRDITMVQSDAIRQLDHRLDELRAQWRKKIDEAKLDVLRRAPQLFVAEMTADLEVLVKDISEHYVAGLTKLLTDLAVDINITVSGLGGLRQRTETPKGRGEGVGDPMMVQMGLMGTIYGGAALGGIGVMAAVAWPAAVVIGSAWIAVNFGFRAVKQGRVNLQQWLDRTIIAVNKDVAREITDRTNAIRPEIVIEYKNYVTDSMNELRKIITKADELKKASLAEQQDERRMMAAKIKEVQTAIAAIDAQLKRYAPGSGAAVPLQRATPTPALTKAATPALPSAE